MSVRRRRPVGPAVPEKLARFVRSEWPRSLSCEDAVRAWGQERESWALAHSWTDGGWPPWTTSPLGDSLDRLRARREARMLACCPPPPQAGNGHR